MDFQAFLNLDAELAGHNTAGACSTSSSLVLAGDDNLALEDTWATGGSRRSDLWSQALDSLMSGAIGMRFHLLFTTCHLTIWFPIKADDIAFSSVSSPRSSESTRGASTSYETSIAGASYIEDDFSQAEKEWRYILNTTPSDPFNIFASTESHDGTDASWVNDREEPLCATRDAANSNTKTNLPDYPTQQPEPEPTVSIQPASSNRAHRTSVNHSTPHPSFRLLGLPAATADENTPTISPITFAQGRQAAHAFNPRLRNSAGNGLSANVLAPVQARGLVGWTPRTPADDLPVMCIPSPTFALPPLLPPCPRPSALRAVPTEEGPRVPVIPMAKRRPQRSNTSSISSPRAPPQETSPTVNSDEDGDSDGYEPSSSAESIALSRRSSPLTFRYPSTDLEAPVSTGGSRPRKKGKAKGSAALALAVVTHMSKLQKGSNDILEDSDGNEQELELPEVQLGRKRKNHPIPLPVPVPHLIKKSRGRKVPDSAPEASSSAVDADPLLDEEDDENVPPSRAFRNTRGSRKPAIAYSLGEGGKRTFKCEVEGCGKCFVRGEHLKRHIRSIHTYDKRTSLLSSWDANQDHAG
jgi:hypothetical protein